MLDKKFRVIDVFHRFDLDSDGYVTRDEMVRGLRRPTYGSFSPGDANVLFDVLASRRKTGRLNYSDFAAALHYRRAAHAGGEDQG